MSDDNTRILPITATIAVSMVLFSTFLPWYSFEVVLPVQRVVHIFFVTTTLWGITTVAPIVIIAASFAAFVLSMIGPRPVANVIIALTGVGVLAYGIVRCFDVPVLGVQIVRGGLPASTQLEGGPFIELSGGLLFVLGALGDLLTAPAGAAGGSRFSSDRWRSGPSVIPR
jgi:hypothetical protein